MSHGFASADLIDLGGSGGGGGTFSGSIAANQIAFGTGVDALGGSANLTWDGTELYVAATDVILESDSITMGAANVYVLESHANGFTMYSPLAGSTGIALRLDGAGADAFKINVTSNTSVDFDLAGSTILNFTATEFSALNYAFDIDQTVGAGQDGFVLTYNNGTGLISLEAAAGGGTHPVTVADGGTGFTAYNTGAMLYTTGTTSMATLERGTTPWGKIMQLSAGLPTWQWPDHILFTEGADHVQTPGAGLGEVWLRSDANQTLMFTDDAGVDHEVAGTDVGGGGGDVTKVGTPANTEIAIWTGDGTLGRDPNFGYDGTTFFMDCAEIDVGSWVLDVDQVVTGANDNHVLTYDDASGEIRLEAAALPTIEDLVLIGASPSILFEETGGVANEQKWNIVVDAGGMVFNALTDADVATPFMEVFRTLGVVDLFSLDASSIDFTCTELVAGNYIFDTDQTIGAGQDNFVLTYDNGTGEISLEAATGGGSPGGSNEQFQYNNGGAFGGITEFTYDDTSPTTNNMFDIAVASSLTTGNVLSIFNSNAGKTGSMVFIGSGNATATTIPLFVSCNGTGDALQVTTSNVGGRAAQFNSAVANRLQPVVHILNDSPTGSGQALVIQQDAVREGLNIAGTNNQGIFMTGGISMFERADHAFTIIDAGRGQFWVNNLADHHPMFTADDGEDFAMIKRANLRDVSISGSSTAQFINMPAWVNCITIVISGLSVSSAGSLVQIQLGDVSTYETTGYNGSTSDDSGATSHSSGFRLEDGTMGAAGVGHYVVQLYKVDASGLDWTCSINGARSNTNEAFYGAGSKTLASALTRLRIITDTGTLDAGVWTVYIS